MIQKLENEFLTNNYKKLAINGSNYHIIYQLRDEGVYVIALWNEDNVNAENCESISRQIKWNFINQGYRNIQLLHIIETNLVDETKKLIGGADCYWIINKDTGQLMIYENQMANFIDAKSIVERVIFSSSSQKPQSRLKTIKNSNYLVTATLIAINVIVFLIMDWSFDNSMYNRFIEYGGSSYQTVVTKYQFYRLITHMFIHGGMDHLFGNMIVLFFLGSQLEKRIGRIHYITLYMVGGIVAAIASLGYNRIYDPITMSVGASGAIFALVGTMVAIVIWDREAFKELGIGRLVFFVMLTVGNGLTTTGIDNAAHIGGLLFGLLVGYTNYRISKKDKENIIE